MCNVCNVCDVGSEHVAHVAHACSAIEGAVFSETLNVGVCPTKNTMSSGVLCKRVCVVCAALKGKRVIGYG